MIKTFACLLSWIVVVTLFTGCVPMVLTGVGVGAGTGALMVEDRRTAGIFIEDERIELRTNRRIKENFGNEARVTVTSYNRNVLLTGEAPNESIKKEIEKLTMSVENVRNIFNEIMITERSSLVSRSNDAMITSKVKTRFLNNNVFQVNHVKVVTTNNVVYLLGLVTREEGEAASQIASTTASVAKVIRVFEYLD
jgi:osmotically-inducible protein OsmY